MHSRERLPDGAAVGPDRDALPARARSASTGFGSPGADATVKRIDLNDALIRHPQATFVVRAVGTAMCGAGIESGDVLLVDKALTAASGNVVVAAVDGELLVRRLQANGRHLTLKAADGVTADISPREGETLELWGVVTTVIKSLLD